MPTCHSSAVNEAPDVENRAALPGADLRRLDPSVKTVWTLKLVLWSLLAVGGVLTYEILHFFETDRLLPFGLLTGAVLLVGLLVSLSWPRLRYRYWRFALRKEELYLERGVLNRVRTVVPLRRIQHLDVSQNVLEREFSLGKLIVHTAGTRSSDVVLPGLALDQAEQLRDTIRKYVLHMEEPF